MGDFLSNITRLPEVALVGKQHFHSVSPDNSDMLVARVQLQ